VAHFSLGRRAGGTAAFGGRPAVRVDKRKSRSCKAAVSECLLSRRYWAELAQQGLVAFTSARPKVYKEEIAPPRSVVSLAIVPRANDGSRKPRLIDIDQRRLNTLQHECSMFLA
jgi:hypothetical protein